MEDLKPAVDIRVSERTDIAEARRAAVRLARELGFEEHAEAKLALVVTEIASNLVKHAQSGRVLLSPVKSAGGQRGMDVFGIDKGPGMRDFARCAQDGYSTAGSPGTGLGAIIRQSEQFDVYTREGSGTVIRARCMATKQAPAEDANFDIGGVVLALGGHPESGDAWATRTNHDKLTLLAVDGLGHGHIAQEAAQAAISVFLSHPHLAGESMVRQIDLALKSTRGAAILLVEIDSVRQRLSSAGVGNIAGAIYSNSECRHLISMNGIVGYRMGQVRFFEYDWQPGSVLIVHSDGLRNRWRLEDYSGLISKSSALIAGVLLRDAARGTDDASIAIVRSRGVGHAA